MKPVFQCLLNACHDFNRKSAFQKASSLAYSTLLSLAPLLALSMTFVAGIYPLKSVSHQAQTFIIENLAPQSAIQVNAVLDRVVSYLENPSTALNVFGYIGLLITSIALFITIEEVANSIWEVKRKRPFYRSLINFWTTITFGPILLFISIGIKIYLENHPYFKIITGTPYWTKGITVILPILFSSFGFFLLFQLIPDTRVQHRFSLICAFTSSILWEFSKWGFSIYVSQAVSYHNLYGSLGAIPIFLLWIYISWVIILFGIHLNFCIHQPRYHDFTNNRRYLICESISWQIICVRILFEICEKFHKGEKGPTDSQLQDKFRLSSETLQSIIDHLFKLDLIDRIRRKEAYLKPARPIESIYIKETFPESMDQNEIEEIFRFILPESLEKKLEEDCFSLLNLNFLEILNSSASSVSHKTSSPETSQ